MVLNNVSCDESTLGAYEAKMKFQFDFLFWVSRPDFSSTTGTGLIHVFRVPSVSETQKDRTGVQMKWNVTYKVFYTK